MCIWIVHGLLKAVSSIHRCVKPWYVVQEMKPGKQYAPRWCLLLTCVPSFGDAADGIFGLRDLKGKVITVDYKNRKLTQSDKVTSAQTEGFTRIPIQTSPNHPGQILIPIEVTVSPGKVISGKALLDTGSGQGLEFTSKAATKYGLDKIED